MYEAVKTVASQDAFSARIRDVGLTRVISPPASTARRLEEEAQFWQGALKDMSITMD